MSVVSFALAVVFIMLGLQICIACERLWREFSEGAHLPNALTLGLVMGAMTYERCFCLMLCISWQKVVHVMKLRRAVAPFTQQFFRFSVATAGWCCCGYLCMRETMHWLRLWQNDLKWNWRQAWSTRRFVNIVVVKTDHWQPHIYRNTTHFQSNLPWSNNVANEKMM